jgi:hypothetical protein
MRMLTFIFAVFCTPTTFAGADEQFHTGVLGLSWGITLQQAQSAYPGGVTWPVQGPANEGVIYAIPGKAQMLRLTTPVRLVQFVFNEKNELRQVFFHFSYEDRDSALYDIGILLGQEYSTKEERDVRRYKWKLGEQTVVQLQVGASTFQPWVELVFQDTKLAGVSRECSCP